MDIKLKICGMKEAENIRSVASLLPDYIGFIFYKGSKRFVGKDFVMPDIPSNVRKVGVFVNEKIEEILNQARNHRLYAVQLHGEEFPEFCGELKSSVKVIKAFGVHTGFDFKVLGPYKDCSDYFLFDTKTENYGGSGVPFDWNLLSHYPFDIPFFLSGGIDSNFISNISDLRSQISHLYAVDVNSKFEISPGIKDVEKLKRFKNELLGK